MCYSGEDGVAIIVKKQVEQSVINFTPNPDRVIMLQVEAKN